jgi:hypothetical protein
MASTISAGTTSGTALNMSADTTGSLILATNGSTTALTINTSQNATFAGSVTATGGIIVGASAAPAFSATPATNQSVTTGVFTKVTLGTKNFDTNNNFASSRFTPTVAGYYQFNASLYANASSPAYIWVLIYKNSAYALTGNLNVPVSSADGTGVCSGILYMNGSTDYVEMYAYIAGGTPLVSGGGSYTQFSGAMIRSA